MSDLWHADADCGDYPCCPLPASDQPLVFDPARWAIGQERSRLRIILIGSLEDVNQEILNLYHCGYEVSA